MVAAWLSGIQNAIQSQLFLQVSRNLAHNAGFTRSIWSFK